MDRVIFVIESKDESAPHSAWEPVESDLYSKRATEEVVRHLRENGKRGREYRVVEYAPREQ